MIKFRLYCDKDKEEEFLNKMSEKGYAMKKFFLGFYSFEQSAPDEYTYRVDLIQDKSAEELKDYIALIEDTGAEFIQKWGAWAFFRKKEDFELYTDIESQISLYRKIRRFFILITGIELCSLSAQINAASLETSMEKFFVSTTILFIIILLICLNQIRKCTKKIKELEKSSE